MILMLAAILFFLHCLNFIIFQSYRVVSVIFFYKSETLRFSSVSFLKSELALIRQLQCQIDFQRRDVAV